MGTKSSHTDQEIKTNTKIDDSSTNNPNNFDESFSTTNNTNMDIGTSKNIQPENKIEERKYPYKFEYKGDGKSVLLAGDFLDNWKSIKVMVKNNDTGIFERMVNLTRKKHQFKFIVDNKWVCSSQYPTEPDERGIINNFIDLTNIPPDNLLKEDLKKNLDKKNLNKNNNFNNGYSTNMPGYNELNTIAPVINGLYKPKFDLDYQSNQNKRPFRLNLFCRVSQRNCANENNTFKKILLVPHDKLMHLCPNLNKLNRKSNNYIQISTTVRNKHKFLTLEYFTPWKNF